MSVDYDPLAEVYDDRYALRDVSELEAALAARLEPGERALEAGCGTGYWLAQCSRWGVRAMGLDPSREMLARAAARLPGAPLVRGRAERLPFREARFDRVLAVQVLHHLDDPRAFVSEARRVLRSGGALLVLALDPTAGGDVWYVYEHFEGTRARDRRRHPAASALRGWLSEAGFVDCHTELAGIVRVDASARELIAAGGLARSSSSQLASLGDEAYRRGMERIERRIAEAEARGETLRLVAALRYYVTSGIAPR